MTKYSVKSMILNEIALEGIDGTGKTTQVKRISEIFTNRGVETVMIHQPIQTPLGQIIRKYLKEPQFERTNPEKMALMFAANRLEMDEILRNPRNRGEFIIHDRSLLSNFVYSNLPLGWFQAIEKYHVRPDLTIILDDEVENVLPRLEGIESYETETKLKSAREGYLMAKALQDVVGPIEILTVTGMAMDEVTEKIVEIIDRTEEAVQKRALGEEK